MKFTVGKGWPLNYHLVFDLLAMGSVGAIVLCFLLPASIEKKRENSTTTACTCSYECGGCFRSQLFRWWNRTLIAFSLFNAAWSHDSWPCTQKHQTLWLFWHWQLQTRNQLSGALQYYHYDALNWLVAIMHLPACSLWFNYLNLMHYSSACMHGSWCACLGLLLFLIALALVIYS